MPGVKSGVRMDNEFAAPSEILTNAELAPAGPGEKPPWLLRVVGDWHLLTNVRSAAPFVASSQRSNQNEGLGLSRLHSALVDVPHGRGARQMRSRCSPKQRVWKGWGEEGTARRRRHHTRQPTANCSARVRRATPAGCGAPQPLPVTRVCGAYRFSQPVVGGVQASGSSHQQGCLVEGWLRAPASAGCCLSCSQRASSSARHWGPVTARCATSINIASVLLGPEVARAVSSSAGRCVWAPHPASEHGQGE